MDVSASFSVSNDVNESEQEPHVLAVDDSLVDRKIVEKLLKTFSCKGTLYTPPFFLFIVSLFLIYAHSLVVLFFLY